MKHNIVVTVEAKYIAEQSREAENQFVFAYTIHITNQGQDAAQLISRRWHIVDANHKVQEVQGLGVVGEQPRILPGNTHSYTSGVVLETQTGTMSGAYQMQYDTGETFEADIPTFALVQPTSLH